MKCVSWCRQSQTRYQQYLQNEVMEVSDRSEKIRDDELMGMREVGEGEERRRVTPVGLRSNVGVSDPGLKIGHARSWIRDTQVLT